ncbi:glucokinase [Pseudoponticoccus marisrubri]|uniref:Glucokinase n=1 Tax=Pseudoponticoccus marisrubri TaxID=1685382 RepID=A0A0W7WMT3_9RHOB|nr:glucokinase [Pseudoponticoccus marisrubri]KUF11871.1 glucokinase [Pseudoponticoccus marisrubri]
MTDTLAVVADIGGTNTRVALCRGATLMPETIRRYRNAENAGIEAVLADYLAQTEARPQACCVDMAGPVTDGVGTLTNLDWRVDSAALKAATGAGIVAVLNDLQAQGHAVSLLGHDSLTPVLSGRPAPANATRLVVNVGTGLNAVPVYGFEGMTLVPPAEAGHVSLQARDTEELRLHDWIAQHHGVPGLEDILSGRGLERIHAWACAEEGDGEPLGAAAIMQAVEEGQPRALRAATLFVRYFGRYAGDLALVTLPFGGIYLVGGVIRHLGPHLLRLGFAEAFADKGRFNAYMTQFPVHLVTDDYAALRGCAGHLAERIAKGA